MFYCVLGKPEAAAVLSNNFSLFSTSLALDNRRGGRSPQNQKDRDRGNYWRRKGTGFDEEPHKQFWHNSIVILLFSCPAISIFKGVKKIEEFRFLDRNTRRPATKSKCSLWREMKIISSSLSHKHGGAHTHTDKREREFRRKIFKISSSGNKKSSPLLYGNSSLPPPLLLL